MRMTSRPAAHDAPMLPPIFFTKSFAMESPNPAEPRAFSTVKKRSNRRFALTSSNEDAAFSKVSVFLHRDAEVAVGVAHRIGYDVAEHPRERVFVGYSHHFILRDIDGGRNAALFERGIKLRERIFERGGNIHFRKDGFRFVGCGDRIGEQLFRQPPHRGDAPYEPVNFALY